MGSALVGASSSTGLSATLHELEHIATGRWVHASAFQRHRHTVLVNLGTDDRERVGSVEGEAHEAVPVELVTEGTDLRLGRFLAQAHRGAQM